MGGRICLAALGTLAQNARNIEPGTRDHSALPFSFRPAVVTSGPDLDGFWGRRSAVLAGPSRRRRNAR